MRVETAKFNVKKKLEYYATNKGTAKNETIILTLLRILETKAVVNYNRTVLITRNLLRLTATSATKLISERRSKKYMQNYGLIYEPEIV